jgi:predicted GNAT family N-acyltransferase
VTGTAALRFTTWRESGPQLALIRETVFIREQNVPIELEWDGLDEDCLHVLATDTQNNPIGCARFTRGGHIQRMAVLKEWRNRGVGSAILSALLEHARSHGFSGVELSAQTQAIPFYRRFGFVEEGGTYMDAGIPHVTMRLPLRQ